jgi:hypothetical protein
VQAVPVPQDLVLLPGRCPVKIRQREEGTLPLPVPIATEDIEALSRRVAALETLVGCLLWVMAKGERRSV